jgi:preprotein translocase SecE subunit
VATNKDTGSNVTRIKASSAASSKKTKPTKEKAVVNPSSTSKRPSASILLRPFIAAGRYFKGAWFELRQVRWPTRSATWSLTGAVLIFTAFFVVLILLLDAGFKYLFEQILG